MTHHLQSAFTALTLIAATTCFGLGCSSGGMATMNEMDDDPGATDGRGESGMMGWPKEDYDAVVATYPEEMQELWPMVWNKCGNASCHGTQMQAFTEVVSGDDFDLFLFEATVEDMAAKPSSGILNSEIEPIAEFLYYASQNNWPSAPLEDNAPSADAADTPQ